MKEALVQKLLAERFQFKSHWEIQERPVYALTVAKGRAEATYSRPDVKHGSGWGH